LNDAKKMVLKTILFLFYFFRAAGIVPKWEKYWNKAQSDAKDDRKQVLILTQLNTFICFVLLRKNSVLHLNIWVFSGFDRQNSFLRIRAFLFIRGFGKFMIFFIGAHQILSNGNKQFLIQFDHMSNRNCGFND
jgi:hypothetical protein